MHGSVSPGTALLAMSASHARRGGARRGGRAVALRLVGAVSARPEAGRPDGELRPPSGRASRLGRDPGRRDDGDRRPQRRRQEQPAQGDARAGAAHRGPHRMHRPGASPTCRSRRRSTAPSRSRCSTPCCSAAGRASAPSARPAKVDVHDAQHAIESVGLSRLRAPADRHAVGRPVPARAVRAAAAAGRRSRPAGRAVRRDRCQDRRRPDGRDPPLAQREAHRRRRAARPRPGAPRLPQQPAAGARAGRLRSDARACCRPRTCCAPAPWPRRGTSTPAPARCRPATA